MASAMTEDTRSGITLPNGEVVPIPPPKARFVQTYDRPVQKIRWTHDMAIDLILEHPEWSQGDIARYFGYSEGWVSMVIQSDAFQAKLSERRDEILSPEVRASVEERFRALAAHSLTKLHEKLANPNVSDNLVLRSAELAARALGLGARPATTTASVQVAIVVPPKEVAA